MSRQRTFDNQSDFHPKPKLTEPVVWVRRIILLESASSIDKPIRDIELRRGLNIVATAKPKRGESEPVGHNVGKTLLTRLIRYCLGETSYARSSVQKEIEAQFPEGVVVAEIYVQGVLWSVVRPFVTGATSASRAWPEMAWREALAAEKRGFFSAYLEALESATTSKLAPVILPGQGREASWRDILAWLSRDQHCAYRDPLEWRDKWTESGTPDLSVEDRSLLVRLAMDLVNPAEEQVIQAKQRLQRQRRQLDEELRGKKNQLEQTRDFLLRRLGAEEDHLANTLFSAHAKDQIEAAIDAHNAELTKIEEKYDVQALELAWRDAQREDVALATQLKVRENDLEQERANTADAKQQACDSLDNGKLACPLKHKECVVHQADLNEPYRLDYRLQVLAAYEERVSALAKEVRCLRRQIREQAEVVSEAQRNLLRAQEEVQSRTALPRRQILERELVLQELNDYEPLQKEIEKLERRLERLEKRWDKLAVEHRDLARSGRSKLKRLNNSLEIVQRKLLGKTPERSIRINVNRLTFTGDDQLTSPGEGMATSATVTLDLACLHASLEGLGHLPRFLIHDSPRGGDLESHLYAQLFLFALALENSYADPPPFQYIIATTTSPPPEVSKKPYVVLELNAKDPSSLLLKRQY